MRRGRCVFRPVLSPSLTALGVVIGMLPSRAGAYRTAADLPEYADTERIRWEFGTIHYEIAEPLPPNVDSPLLEDAVQAAFDAWSSIECAPLSFMYGGALATSAAPGDGRVTLQWVDHGWIERGFAPNAAATTDLVYQRDARGYWRIVDADIYLNSVDFAWTTDEAAGGQDLRSVITHEVGHVLGLLHPCEVGALHGAPECNASHVELTMYPEYFGVEQQTLEADDVAGACFLYSPPACELSGCADGMACTIEGCVAWCDPTSCSGGTTGDPCVDGAECSSGHCTGQGYCAPLCDEVEQCPSEYFCDRFAEPPECLTTEGVFGESCSAGSDCASGRCLIEDGSGLLCTRACGGGEGACPGGFECSSVDGLDVCVVPREGGCAVSSAPGPTGVWLARLMETLLLLSLLLANRSRGGRS